MAVIPGDLGDGTDRPGIAIGAPVAVDIRTGYTAAAMQLADLLDPSITALFVTTTGTPRPQRVAAARAADGGCDW
jgi:hypothetical protein